MYKKITVKQSFWLIKYEHMLHMKNIHEKKNTCFKEKSLTQNKKVEKENIVW